jgi:hypothetical protein
MRRRIRLNVKLESFASLDLMERPRARSNSAPTRVCPELCCPSSVLWVSKVARRTIESSNCALFSSSFPMRTLGGDA